MIYGAGAQKLNKYGLLEMKEVSFALNPTGLKMVAQFFQTIANEMEAGQAEPGWHRHIETYSKGWRRAYPGLDIVVLAPAEKTLME